MKKQISFSRLILVTSIIGLFLFPSLLSALDPIQIGETNCPYALAYSNARKIVRTSFGRLVVVFQDSLEHKPIVKWTYSDDGISWTEPELLDRGSQPALTIAKDDMIYCGLIYEDREKIVVNSLAPDTTGWNTKFHRMVVWPSDKYDLQHPGLEVTEHSVNLVFQATQNGSNHIYYQSYTRDLSQCLSTFINFSGAEKSAVFPVIVGDLEFEKDLIYIFWSTPQYSGQASKIGYGMINEKVTNNTYEVVTGFGGELPFSGMMLQSASLRNNKDTETSTLVAVFVLQDRSAFVTSLLDISYSGAEVFNSDVIHVSRNPMPTVDDVYIRSCAVCWCDSGTIYYAQNVDGKFITDPIPVSEFDVNARQPNICYKTFRRDFFDVVWLEGTTPPFRVMYRRMDKQYEPVNVEKPANDISPVQFALFQNYPNPFNPETEIRYQLPRNSEVEISIFNLQGQKIKTLIHGHQSAGTYTVKWNGMDENGNGVASGVYLYQMHAGKFLKARKMLLLR